MNEKFLQFVWHQLLFDKLNLVSTNGDEIKIVHQGYLNNDSGPDFFNAKIKIAQQLWAGNVEIHINSSDWNKHKHYLDSAYDNVILHVVQNFDIEILNSKGITVPTLVLKYDNKLFENYTRLIMNKGPIPCSNYFEEIDSFYVKSWENRLLIQRFERKTEEVFKILDEFQNSWEETFYIFLAKNFGFKINSIPFELLAKSISLKSIYKQKDNLLQIEALLFGQAGFLDNDCNDDYFKLLKREYVFLAEKYNLHKLNSSIWKFLRLRPVNFPTIRIAQFASVLYKNINLFSKIIETENLNDIKSFFDITISNYWLEHYLFGKKSVKKSKKIGENTINGILINTVALFLFAYGQKYQSALHNERALNLLELVAAEKNSIVAKWESEKIIPQNSFESQAILELYNQYCKEGRCLDCSIGAKIIIRENY